MRKHFDLSKSFKHFVEKHSLLSIDDRLIVGFSGGPDSTCLLHLLLSLSEEYNLDIKLLHINYSLRGIDSEEDMLFAEKLANETGTKLQIVKAKIDKDENVQQKAREIRLTELLRIAENEKRKIVLGHNLDDNVETFLFRLFKGSSISGLSSMSYRTYWKSVEVLRPLLNFTKKDIVDFLKQNSFEYRIDKSNYENKYSRNVIRNEILPIIERYFPQSKSKIADTINIIQTEKDAINEIVEANYKKAYLKQYSSKHVVSISLTKLKDINRGIISGVIKKALSDIEISEDNLTKINFETIIDNIAECKFDGSSELLNKSGYSIWREYSRLTFYNLTYQKELNYMYLREGINHTTIYDIVVSRNLCDKDSNSLLQKVKSNKRSNEIYITAIDLPNLIVDRWTKGDYISYSIDGKTKKLKEIFIDMKIPKKIRDQACIIKSDKEIIAVFLPEPFFVKIINPLYYISDSTTEYCKIIIDKVNQ